MATRAIEIENLKTGEVTGAVYEHPLIVRLCHWINAVALLVMVGSGLQIFRAFPSFGAKIPQQNLIDWPKSLALGGWLGGALQWHLTFMWIYMASGLLYAAVEGSLQPAAETRLHVGHCIRRPFGVDRFCDLEASAVLLAGVADGRIPSGAIVAFSDHVGDARFCVWPSGDGGIAWLE